MTHEDELTNLIRCWEADPIFVLEEAEGFEEDIEYLKAYRLQAEAGWKEQSDRVIQERCKKHNCNTEMVRLIDSLQRRIEKLEALCHVV